MKMVKHFFIISLITLFILMSSLVGLFVIMGCSLSEIPNILKFIRVFSLVKHQYVKNVSAKTLFNGSIKGMLEELKDDHSVYLNEKDMNNFIISTKGNYGGIGIILEQKEKRMMVILPIENTPAANAGVKSGDILVKINGERIDNLDPDIVVNKMRGTPGSFVVITTLRGEKIKESRLRRKIIELKTIYSKMIGNKIGYIRISMFNENTGNEFDKIWNRLENENMQAVILDLRNNPGGLIDECVKIGRYFIPKGPIVTTINRKGEKKVYYSERINIRYPLIILVNKGSASASEIIAGAVQDTKSGTLIGEQTYGKGTIQEMKYLGDGSAIKLTIAKYVTPNNHFIDKVGIKPDINVQLASNYKKDIQLEKAKEILKSRIH